MNQFSTGLDKNKANYIPLSPLSFITRAKDIYPNYESVVYVSIIAIEVTHGFKHIIVVQNLLVR